MQLLVDDQHPGPSEREWLPIIRRVDAPALDTSTMRRLVVVAPHPDDEVLGTGGLIRWALVHSVPIKIVAVSDGERSHPTTSDSLVQSLAVRRIQESHEALRRLGWESPVITRLSFPDGDVGHYAKELDDALGLELQPNDFCAAPWRRDGHPDHDAVGRSAQRVGAQSGACVWSYFVWTWHWANPAGHDIPWSRARRLALSRRDRARKRWAISAFETQVRPLDSGGGAPVLPAAVLPRFWRDAELYFDERCVTSSTR